LPPDGAARALGLAPARLIGPGACRPIWRRLPSSGTVPAGPVQDVYAMKSKNALALFTAAALVSLPILAAEPPPPPAPPAPAVKTTTVSTNMSICYAEGKTLAACAAGWQTMTDAGNKVDNMKTAWEASGFENYVAGIRVVNEDLSWCNPPGTETTYEESFKIVAQYLADHPEKYDSEPATLVTLALKAAYPCGKKGH
jgi:Rap1a immunity proteins